MPEASRVRFTYPPDAGAPCAPASVVIDLEGTGPDEHIVRQIRSRRRFYESDLLEHLAGQGPRHGVYVDVGANIGNHSVFFGRFLADHVVAIEPNPSLLALLERNLRANAVGRWTILPVAIGSGLGAGRLVAREGFEGNDGALRVLPADAPATGVTVEVDTLDHVLAQLGADVAGDVRLVKLDIEGMEMEALHGASQLLERQGPDVVVEAAAEADHVKVGSLLSAYGYREVARFCITPTYHFSQPDRSWPRGPRTSTNEENR